MTDNIVIFEIGFSLKVGVACIYLALRNGLVLKFTVGGKNAIERSSYIKKVLKGRKNTPEGYFHRDILSSLQD